MKSTKIDNRRNPGMLLQLRGLEGFRRRFFREYEIKKPKLAASSKQDLGSIQSKEIISEEEYGTIEHLRRMGLILPSEEEVLKSDKLENARVRAGKKLYPRGSIPKVLNSSVNLKPSAQSSFRFLDHPFVKSSVDWSEPKTRRKRGLSSGIIHKCLLLAQLQKERTLQEKISDKIRERRLSRLRRKVEAMKECTMNDEELLKITRNMLRKSEVKYRFRASKIPLWLGLEMTQSEQSISLFSMDLKESLIRHGFKPLSTISISMKYSNKSANREEKEEEYELTSKHLPVLKRIERSQTTHPSRSIPVIHQNINTSNSTGKHFPKLPKIKQDHASHDSESE